MNETMLNFCSPLAGQPTYKSHACFLCTQPHRYCCRDWLYQYLESRGFSLGFRLWMGSNLQVRHRKYWWTFDIKCAQQLYLSYQQSEYWDLVDSPPEGVSLNLVRAENSDRCFPALHCPTS